MRFASFTTDAGDSWGVLEGDHVFDLGPTGAGTAPSLRAAIAALILDNLSEDDWRSARRRGLGEVRLLPVIPDPAKIICVGVNYKAHQEESGRSDAVAPTIFTRFADTQMGHGAPALRPGVTEKFDYEGELALVIGKPAFRVSQAESWDYIAGYAPYNDFSVRDWQKQTSQWIPGKNFPGTGGFGPAMTRARDIPDVTALTLETRVNGEVRQHASVSDLIFTIPEILEYVTTFTALAPGDVIVTGTPGGVGVFFGPDGLLTEGDVVDVEITELGVLTNTVVQDVAADAA